MADETVVTQRLVMDRTEPLGNTEGSNNRRRLHVFVDQLSGEAIPTKDEIDWDTITPTHPDDFTVVWTYTLVAVTTQVITVVYPDKCHTGDPTITRSIP